MKAVIIFAALLALSFASDWATCNTAPNDTYIQPLNVTLTKNETSPKLTVHFCGKSKENIHIHGYSIYTFVDDSKFAVGGDESYSGSIPINAGQEFCYDIITFGYYIFPANYTFRVQLKDDDKNNLNCLDATMIVKGKDNTLLSF